MRRIRRALVGAASATLKSKFSTTSPGAAWIRFVLTLLLVGSRVLETPAYRAMAQERTPPVVAPASVNVLPPIISSIADQTINEDGTTGPISFTLTDLDTPADQLSVSGSSSNGILIPLASILFGGSGANRTVTITPPPNLNGTAKVIIIVSDGSASTFTDFDVTVNPINDAPAISAIAAQSTQEDVTTNAIGFTLSDVDTPVNALSLTGTSSNTTLIPSGKITFGGSGTNRTLRLMPASNQFGSSLITVTVTDGSASSLTTFVLTVSPVNDAPSLAQISDQTTPEDIPAGPIPVSISDVDTPAASLSISVTSSNASLLPPTRILVMTPNGITSPISLLLTPMTNQNGTAQITLLASDGDAAVSTTFTLSVVAVNDAPTLSAIANQTSTGKAVGPLAFQVDDVDDAPTSLTLSTATSNPALVPPGNIAFGTSGGNGISRTVWVTPALNQAGTAIITLTASDGSATAHTEFVVRVFNLAYLPIVLFNAPCDNSAVDCYEPNNLIGQASSIPVTQTLLRGTLTNADSRDFYAFTLTSGRRYTFTLNTNGSDLDLYLYGNAPGYVQLAQSNITGVQAEQIVFVPGTTNTYYLLVYNFFASTPPLFKPYSLQVN